MTPCQGRLASGIVNHHIESFTPQRRLDHQTHQQIETVVTLGFAHIEVATLSSDLAQRNEFDSEGIEFQRLTKKLAIAPPTQWPQITFQHSADQRRRLLDQRIK